MVKLNSLRTITFLKASQLFLRITIFVFLITLFILSCTISNKIIISDVANNQFLIGFYQVEIIFANANDAILTISPAFIAIISVILFLIIASCTITWFLYYKFSYVKNCFNQESILFIVSSILMLLFIIVSFFSQSTNLDVNFNDTIVYQTNAIFDIKIAHINQYYGVDLSYTKYGIAYLTIGSYMMFGIIYYPAILLYRLLKIKYI